MANKAHPDKTTLKLEETEMLREALKKEGWIEIDEQGRKHLTTKSENFVTLSLPGQEKPNPLEQALDALGVRTPPANPTAVQNAKNAGAALRWETEEEWRPSPGLNELGSVGTPKPNTSRPLTAEQQEKLKKNGEAYSAGISEQRTFSLVGPSGIVSVDMSVSELYQDGSGEVTRQRYQDALAQTSQRPATNPTKEKALVAALQGAEGKGIETPRFTQHTELDQAARTFKVMTEYKPIDCSDMSGPSGPAGAGGPPCTPGGRGR